MPYGSRYWPGCCGVGGGWCCWCGVGLASGGDGVGAVVSGLGSVGNNVGAFAVVFLGVVCRGVGGDGVSCGRAVVSAT